MATSSAASSGDPPKLPDIDELIDEVLAEKGPTKYTGGLSEEKWEEVCLLFIPLHKYDLQSA